jgi:hypothetical protein
MILGPQLDFILSTLSILNGCISLRSYPNSATDWLPKYQKYSFLTILARILKLRCW